MYYCILKKKKISLEQDCYFKIIVIGKLDSGMPEDNNSKR